MPAFECRSSCSIQVAAPTISQFSRPDAPTVEPRNPALDFQLSLHKRESVQKIISVTFVKESPEQLAVLMRCTSGELLDLLFDVKLGHSIDEYGQNVIGRPVILLERLEMTLNAPLEEHEYRWPLQGMISVWKEPG